MLNPDSLSFLSFAEQWNVIAAGHHVNLLIYITVTAKHLVEGRSWVTVTDLVIPTSAGRWSLGLEGDLELVIKIQDSWSWMMSYWWHETNLKPTMVGPFSPWKSTNNSDFHFSFQVVHQSTANWHISLKLWQYRVILSCSYLRLPGSQDPIYYMT